MRANKHKEDNRSQRDRIILYKRVFNSVDGKQVLFDLMNRNFILNSHNGDQVKEGRRAAVLDIITLSKINLKEFDKLLEGEQ